MRVFNLTRDQFSNFVSEPGDRAVSLDFNHNGDNVRITSGIELVMPKDSTRSEMDLGILWCKKTHELFGHFGINTTLRRNNGLMWDRGYPGVIHTEPFFAKDTNALNCVFDHSDIYTHILAMTLGRIPGVKFILPHKQTDPGATATTPDGPTNERDFAKEHLIPHLIRRYGESILVPAERQEDDTPGQVTFRED